MEDALKQSLPTAASKKVNEALKISRSEKRRNAKLAAQAQQGEQQQDDQHHYKNADKGKSKGKSSKGKGKKGKGKKGDQRHEERKNPVRLLPAHLGGNAKVWSRARKHFDPNQRRGRARPPWHK